MRRGHRARASNGLPAILALALGPFKKPFMPNKKEGDMVDTSDIERGDVQELFLRHNETFKLVENA